MTVRELIDKLLDIPMNHEISLYYDKEHIDEYGEKCSGYCFDIDDVRKGEIVFTDWRDNAELPKHTNSLPTKADNEVKPYNTVNAIFIPDNATNGDMIKTMFPKLRIDELYGNVIQVMGQNYEFRNEYSLSWWNAPYKAASAPQESEER